MWQLLLLSMKISLRAYRRDGAAASVLLSGSPAGSFLSSRGLTVIGACASVSSENTSFVWQTIGPRYELRIYQTE